MRSPADALHNALRFRDRRAHGANISGNDILGMLAFHTDFHLLGDVVGEFHNLCRLAGAVEDWIVGCLNPNFASILGKAPELARDELTPPEHVPKILVFLGLREFLRNKCAVVSALIRPLTDQNP